jgi:hypothetical protein
MSEKANEAPKPGMTDCGKTRALYQGTTLVVPVELYILARLNTWKSAQDAMLSTLTTFGFVSGHGF